MIIKNIILILSLIALSGCQQYDKDEEVDVDQEIAGLKTHTEKEKYLVSIFRLDQNIRNGESSEILLKYGENSEELRRFYKKMDSIDRLNMKRVESYLDQFEYPDRESFSQNAIITPWLVIHHSSDIKTRKKYFQVLKRAYQNGNLTSNQFDLFLGRTYHIKNGKYPSWEGPYKPDEKIDWLIDELDLEQ